MNDGKNAMGNEVVVTFDRSPVPAEDLEALREALDEYERGDVTLEPWVPEDPASLPPVDAAHGPAGDERASLDERGAAARRRR